MSQLRLTVQPCELAEANEFVRLHHRPGAVQTEIRVGHVGLVRKIPDFHAVSVMSAILGGLFGSRLNMRLREEKGYTYGAHAGFDLRVHPGPFGARAAVETNVTAAAVTDLIAEIRRMRETDVTEDELRAAKDYLIGVFPLRFETPGAGSYYLLSTCDGFLWRVEACGWNAVPVCVETDGSRVDDSLAIRDGLVQDVGLWILGLQPAQAEQHRQDGDSSSHGGPVNLKKLASQAMGARYQMVADGKQVFLVDLTNGRVWRYFHHTKEAGFSQEDEGFLPIGLYYAGKKHYAASEIEPPPGAPGNPPQATPAGKQPQ